MKNLFNKTLIVMSLFIAPLLLSSCEKSNGPKRVTLLSDPDNDGYIVNSSPRQVNTTGESLIIGWTSGYSCRSFVSFDITDIMPSGDKTLVIEKAVLRVHQKNYNMLPFTGSYDGIDRVAEAYLVSYGSLESTDYSLQSLANCGVLASYELPLHAEASLDVTSKVAEMIADDQSATLVQFRIQLTDDANTDQNVLDAARWYLFPGEDPDDEDYYEYRPALEITYSYL